MARKKKGPKDTFPSESAVERYLNLPTRERMARGGIAIANNMAREGEPLRIDKLLRNGIIDEMQHLYGLQIITLWTIASRPFLKATRLERMDARLPDFDLFNLNRMGAEDQFYKTMSLLSVRDRQLICKICFEEMAVIEAGRQLKLPVNSVTVYLRAAFDALGDALAQMRSFKKELETPPQSQEE